MIRTVSDRSHDGLTGSFEIGVLLPPGATGDEALFAAGRAGELPILDTAVSAATSLSDPSVLEDRILRLRETTKSRFGLRIDVNSSERVVSLLSKLSQESQDPLIDWVLISGAFSAQAMPRLTDLAQALHPYARRIFREVVSQAEAEQAITAGVDGLMAKGSESGGRVGSETTFVLLQRLCRQFGIPIWAQGGIGPSGAAACRVAGAKGILLDCQLALAEESSLPDGLRQLVAAMDGSETLCLGESLGCGFRVHRLRGAAHIRALQDLENAGADREAFLHRLRELSEVSDGEALLPIGQEAGFAAQLGLQYRNVAGILRAYRSRTIDNLKIAATLTPLAEGGPLAQEHGTRFPIVQGPMTRVSDVAPFADAVCRAGALSFLALALLREAETERLLRDTAARLGDCPWGVGILGFVPAEIRAEQLRAVLKVRPKFALLAGGRPDQAHALESEGIATYIHTPSARLLEMFLRDGSRRFVFEGRECGGHVGPLSSFVLWESVLEVLIEFCRKNGSRERVDVLFAGGIHDSVSAAMVSALAAPAVAAGVRIGVLMGTAYLFTEEAVSSGAIVPAFQEAALRCEDTVLLDTQGGHAIRCVPTPYADEFADFKRKLLRSGATPEEARRQLEEVNLGRLRIASKGIMRAPGTGQSPDGARLMAVPAERQRQEGMYMIGEVASLRTELCTMEELHQDVANGSAERLRASLSRESNAELVARRTGGGRDQVPDPIAIIGIGCVFPGAPELSQFWSNIYRKHDAIKEVPAGRWQGSLFYDANPSAPDRVCSKWGGFIDPVVFDPVSYGIPPTSVRSIEPMQLLMLEMVRRAFKDAAYDQRPFPRERTAVIIATGGTSNDLAMAYQTRCMVEHFLEQVPELDLSVRSQVIAGLRRVLPALTEDSFPGILPNVSAGRVANRFDLGGPNMTVDAACASSLAALEVAVKELRHRTSDLVVLGGVDAQQGVFNFLLFSKTHALSKSGRCRPFDAHADGIAISEGVAVVLLKRLEDAVRDGDRVYSVLRGIGGGSDGRDKSLTAPSVNGQRRAVERAYDSLEFSPSSLGLVEAHGTGTVVGDKAELETLRSVLEAAGAAPQRCALGSVKSQIGHTKNAAGLAGLIKVSLALHHRMLPPTLATEPNAAVKDRSIPLYLNTRSRPWFQTAEEPRRAAVSAFGFGGTNFHAVLEEFPAHSSTSPDRPAELLMLRAASRTELAGRVESLEQTLASGRRARLIDVAALVNRESARSRGDQRLAIVATSLDDLRTRLGNSAAALRGDRAFGEDGPAFYADAPSSGSTAFLFSGQGSQYLNMLEELALFFPVVREVFEKASRVLSSVLPDSLLDVIFPPPAYSLAEEKEQRQRLDQTWFAQPALGAADFALYSLLTEIGIKPDLVGGLSYGEYVALCAAGSLAFPDLIRISEMRGRVVQETQGCNEIGLVAVREKAEALERLVENAAGVSIAGKNSPTQTVIGGSRAAIESFLPRLDAAGLSYQLLPLSAGFHIPEARPAADRLAEILKQVQIVAPRISVYSNRTAGIYPHDVGAVRRLLIEQLTEPVRFQEEIEAMYEAGARTFIEVGPGQVLSGLARQTLGGKSTLILASNKHGSSSATLDFLRVIGRLFVNGAAVRWEKLFAGCTLRALQMEELRQAEEPPSATAWFVDCGGVKPVREVAERPAASGTATKIQAPAATHPPAQATPPKTEPVAPPKTALPPAPSPALPSFTAFKPHENGSAADVMTAFQSAMRGFLEYQAKAQDQRQQLMTQFLDTQRAVFEALAGSSSGNSFVPARAEAVIQQAATFQDSSPVALQSFVLSPPSHNGNQPAAVEPSNNGNSRSVHETQADLSLDSVQNLEEMVLGLVSERTGYPVDMLELDHNLEADLGIDSIKRTEIFGALRERLGLAGEAFEKEAYFLTMGKLRTLREVLAWLNAEAPVARETSPAATNGHGESPAAELVDEFEISTRRQIVRVVASLPDEGTREPREDELVLITEDGAGRAREVTGILRAMGHSVALVRHATSSRMVSPGIYEVDLLSRDGLKQLREWVDQNQGKVTTLCHLLPLDTGALGDGAGCPEVKSLFLLANTFGPDLRKAKGALFAVTGMGGAFGLNGQSGAFHPGQAAVPGFLKSLAREWPEVLVKSVDINPQANGDLFLPQLLAEFSTADRTVEVGYTVNGRSVLVPMESELDRSGEPFVQMNEDSVLLVTGGARGITAAICIELAERYRPRLLLVGRSPRPEAESAETADLTIASDLKRAISARRKRRGELVTPAGVESEYQSLLRAREMRATFDRLSSAGARFEYHALDVRDDRAFGALIESVYERYGRIDGVIHGAGVIEDALITGKSPESFDRVLHTKVSSALTLARTLRPETLRFLAFFSSVTARFGNTGQADYAAANEALNKLACKLDREWQTRVVSIGWGPWAGAGMASPHLREKLAQMGFAYLPARVGCELFLQEIIFGRKSEAEVLIYAAEGEGPQMAYSGEPAGEVRSLTFSRSNVC